MSEFGNKLKGKIKQSVGRVMGNDRLRREGERDQLRGEAEGVAADVKDKMEAASEKLSQKVKGHRK